MSGKPMQKMYPAQLIGPIPHPLRLRLLSRLAAEKPVRSGKFPKQGSKAPCFRPWLKRSGILLVEFHFFRGSPPQEDHAILHPRPGIADPFHSDFLLKNTFAS